MCVKRTKQKEKQEEIIKKILKEANVKILYKMEMKETMNGKVGKI